MSPYAQLTAEHDSFRSWVREELARLVLPEADRWEAERRLPADAWRALAARGLLALPHTGEGFLRSAVLLEELGRTGYAGVRAAVAVHAYMATSYLSFGSESLRERHLPAVRSGELVAALAITEADAGSDLRHLRTRAEPDGERGYRVTGEKLYVANGSRAGLVIALVRSRPARPGPGLAGLSLLAIDGDSPGLTREPQSMLGWHSADVCRLRFADVPVPADRVIGRPDRTLLYLVRALDFERLVAGLLALGGAGYCLDVLNRFAAEHRLQDAPLTAKQVVRHRLADLNAEFDLVRHYAYHVAWQHSRGRLDTRSAAVLKLRASELAVAAAEVCLRYHGARGYLSDSAAARLHRDAIAGTVAAGASELLRDMIFEGGPPEQW